MCHTRYGSFPGNSHRPCGLTLPKGRDPSGLPAADKTCLPSVGAAAPIGTTFRRSYPYKIGGAKFCTFAQSISTAFAATCIFCYNQVLLPLALNAIPLIHCISLNSYKKLNTFIPPKRLIRFATKCKSCRNIIHRLHMPKRIPVCKNGLQQICTVNVVCGQLFIKNRVNLTVALPKVSFSVILLSLTTSLR